MRKLILILAALCCAAAAQTQRFDSQATASTGQPGSIQLQAVLPGSTVYACTGSTAPCAAPGTASLFSDIAGTVPLAQPVVADASGRFGWYWAAGTYTITITPPAGSIGTVQSYVVTTGATAAPSFSVTTPTPAAPAPVTATVVGTPGSTTYYYWVVSRFTIGNSAPSAAAVVTTAAATLSQYNYDQIAWPVVTGANTYDVLRTTSATAPTGACACAVATAVNALTTNDQSNTLSAYTVNTYAGNTAFNITNAAVGAGESKLTFAADHGTQFSIDNITGATITGLTATHPAITPTSIESVEYADQFSGATLSAKVTAACSALTAIGVVVIPSTMGSGSYSIPSGCTVIDERGNIGSGAIATTRVLPWYSTGVLSGGNYVEGITATGTQGQTCDLTGFNDGSTATATVALTGTNTIAIGTAIAVTNGGAGATAPPTTATATDGTATCSGTATLSTALSGPDEQYGATFSAEGLASDANSAIALLGIVPSGTVGKNVLGVKGIVYAGVGSAGVYGENFGAGSGCATGTSPCEGGAGVQGDAASNSPGGLGVLGVGCATPGGGGGTSTAASPCYGVVGQATGNATYGANIGGYFYSDNGPPLVANLIDTGGSIDPSVLIAKSAEPTSTDIALINTSTQGARFDLRSSGASDPCIATAGYFELFSGSAYSAASCPLAINSGASNLTFLIDGASGVHIGGYSHTAIYDSSDVVQNGGTSLTTSAPACGSGAATVANCTASQILAAATLSAGTITIASAISGSYSFTTAYSTAPICTASESGTTPVALTFGVTSSTTAVTVTLSTSGSGTFTFMCSPAVN